MVVLHYRVTFSAPARAVIGCRRGITRPPSQPQTTSERSSWSWKKKKKKKKTKIKKKKTKKKKKMGIAL